MSASVAAGLCYSWNISNGATNLAWAHLTKSVGNAVQPALRRTSISESIIRSSIFANTSGEYKYKLYCMASTA